MISEEGIQAYIDLYEKKYSIRLSREDAFKLFSELIAVVKITCSKPNQHGTMHEHTHPAEKNKQFF